MRDVECAGRLLVIGNQSINTMQYNTMMSFGGVNSRSRINNPIVVQQQFLARSTVLLRSPRV